MAEGYVGSAWIGEIIAAMRELGFDTDELLEGLPGLISGPDGTEIKLEIGSARRLYHRIDRMADDPLLGVKLAQRIDDGATGFLAVLLWHAPTLGHALDNIMRFQWSLSENGGYVASSIGSGEERARLYEYVPEENAIECNRHQSLAVLASTVLTIRRISRRRSDIAWMRVPPTLDAQAIGAALGCECRVAPGNSAFAVAEGDLRLPITGRDNELYSIVMQHALGVSRRRERRNDLVQDIRAAVRANGFAAASLPQVERDVAIHRRLIQRSLSDMNLTFREVKEEVIRNEAIAMLIDSRCSAGEVAVRLGYSEPSAFHRAFRNWFGTTPRNFRDAEVYVS